MTTQIGIVAAEAFALSDAKATTSHVNDIERSQLGSLATQQGTSIKTNGTADVANQLSDKSKEEQAPLIADDEVENAANVLENFVSSEQNRVRFSVTEDTGRMVIQIIDQQSNEVLRQIPAEEVLEMASRVKELTDEIGKKTGILFEDFA